MNESIGEIISEMFLFAFVLLKAIALAVLMTAVLAIVVGGAIFVVSSPFVYRTWIRGVEVHPDRVVRLTFRQFYRLNKSMPNEFKRGHVSKQFDNKMDNLFYWDMRGDAYQVQFSFVDWNLYRLMVGFNNFRDWLKRAVKTKSEKRDDSIRNTETALRIVNDMQDKLRKDIAP